MSGQQHLLFLLLVSLCGLCICPQTLIGALKEVSKTPVERYGCTQSIFKQPEDTQYGLFPKAYCTLCTHFLKQMDGRNPAEIKH
jgi:hypothetical protein